MALKDKIVTLEDLKEVGDEVSDLKDDLSTLDDIINGSETPATYYLPTGYQNANYSNVAGTLKYKYENGQLVLSKSNGSSGQITTTNASLTIDETLMYNVGENQGSKASIEYENDNAQNVASIIFYFYDANVSLSVTAQYYIPNGTGTSEIDLEQLAADNNIDLSIKPKIMIRGIKLESGQQQYSTFVVYFNGFGIAGTGSTGLVEKVEDIEAEVDDISDDLQNISNQIELLYDVDDESVGKVPSIASIASGKVTSWNYISTTTTKNGNIGSNEYLLRKEIPTCYLSYPANPVSFDEQTHIDECIARVPEGKSFIFVTDTHWESNAKHTFELIQYVKEKLGIHKVLFGGDCIDRGSNKYLGLNLIRAFMKCAVDACGKDFIVTIGNHDLNTGNAINDNLDIPTYRVPYDQIYDVYISHLGSDAKTEDWSETISQIAQSDTDAAELTGWTKLHYYVDDDDDKTRYIVIYSSAYDDTIVPTYTGFSMDGGGGPTTVMQYDWFANTLMCTPADYDIIVLAHCADAENKTFPEQQLLRNQFDFFTRIASAFHKKCSGYKIDISNFSESGYPTNPFWTRETKQYDFSNAPTVGKILFVAGHIHKNVEYVTTISTDSTVYPTYVKGKARNNGNPALVGEVQDVTVFDNSTVDFATGEMLTIISQNDAYNRVTPNKYPYSYGEMTLDTVSEQSFDVITLTDNAVVCTKIGAGWDRTIPVDWT